MLNDLPIYVNLIFGITTFLTVWLFYLATKNSTTTIVILMLWLIVQTVVGLSGFYTMTSGIPPRFSILVLPPLFFITGLFIAPEGRKFLDHLDIKFLTILHIIRIPVELVLFWLFVNKAVPKLMTMEGRNFDILSGITAPLIFYYGFIRKQISKKIILLWNFICLALLLNIVVSAVLSAPFPFQKFGFDQPDIAILYFPLIWLPCCVVPLVLLSHLATIRQLLK